MRASVAAAAVVAVGGGGLLLWYMWKRSHSGVSVNADHETAIVVEDTQLAWAARQIRAKKDLQRSLNLVKGWSTEGPLVERMIGMGFPDLLMSLTEDHGGDVAFILANMATHPRSHPFFFSRRFSLQVFMESQHQLDGLRILLNLTSADAFAAKQCVEKLDAERWIAIGLAGPQRDMAKSILNNLEKNKIKLNLTE